MEFVSIIILEWKYFAPIGMLYNILLPINCYIGNNTTKCHSGSMSDNRDLTGGFHQFLHFLWSLHVILDISNHEYAPSVAKYSILQLPVKAV